MATRQENKNHRKPASDRKEHTIRLRVTKRQRQDFEKAAARSGLDLSGWLRMVAAKASKDDT